MCQLVQDGGQSRNWPGIRDQYPQDTVKPAKLKNDVNSIRSFELNEPPIIFAGSYWIKLIAWYKIGRWLSEDIRRPILFRRKEDQETSKRGKKNKNTFCRSE